MTLSYEPLENKAVFLDALTTILTAYKLRQSKMEIERLKCCQQKLCEDIDKKYTDFIASSPPMLEIIKTINKVAKTDANIFIIGENGTGKELVARELHRQSNKSSEVFITVDMAALSETIFEIELISYKNPTGRVIILMDNGTGIKKDNIDQIFIPFFSTREKGSGIGLSLSKQIMQVHGGTISVKSITNNETSFILVF